MSKLPIFEWFLARGDVLITVNTHVDGVDIPPYLRRQEMVDFILGATPTPKMMADEKGVSASMRFSGNLHNCHFPWASVMQMSAHDAVIQFRTPTPAASAPPKSVNGASNSKVKSRGNLRLVK